VQGTITLTNTVTIATNTTIDGSGQMVTISGNNAVRVFTVNQGVFLTLNKLTVASGKDSSTDGGGGISSIGGTLLITNSRFIGNSTNSRGGGIFVRDGNLTVINSTFNNNSANVGGGIQIDRGETVNIVDSTFSGNSAYTGGGIFNNNGSNLNVSNCTFDNNSGDVYGGGGIYANSLDSTAGFIVSNSTFYGNFAAKGGGIYNDGFALAVSNSTFSYNSSLTGSAILNVFGTTVLKNTILANSRMGRNCVGIIKDGGGNLTYPDTTCPGINESPLLGPLQDNGGSTLTLALGAGSAAIDAGNDAICAAAPVNNLDQRGIARPQGAHCDIGAVEMLPASQPHPFFIDIDIKSGSGPNSINRQNANEIITVAILTTDAFDATIVDHRTVIFEGAGETHEDHKTSDPRRHEEDIDGDEDIDLVFHFRLGDTHLTCASPGASLWGETLSGQPILGVDWVRMVGGG
jgi:predicted outer membrane repeat protein